MAKNRIIYKGIVIESVSRRFRQLRVTTFARMRRLWKNAIDAFLEEIIFGVGVESGMSGASFFPLVAKAGKGPKFQPIIRGKAAAIRTVTKKRRFILDQNGNPTTRRRSLQAGIEVGKANTEVFFGTPANPIFTFSYDIKIFQLQIDDNHKGFIDRGTAAFINHINQNAKNIVPKNLADILNPWRRGVRVG